MRPPRRPWPDYRAVWRWHFYAGLFCIPFVCWLAVTGSIYLWKPQVEAWIDRPYAHLLAPGQARTPPSRAIAAALAAEPGSVLHAYQLPASPGAAAQVLVGRGVAEWRVWIDPRDARVLKIASEDGRLMNVVLRLHGELLLGDRGSMLVELAGSWAVVMILTGLFLWWPRGAQGLAGVLYPRLYLRGRPLWRDLHATAGVWVSGLTLLLLISGLPWAASWGGYLKAVRQLAGQATVRQDWTIGHSSALAQRAALSAGSLSGQQVATSDAMDGMVMNSAASTPSAPARSFSPFAYARVDRVASMVDSLHLAYPVLVTPPLRPGGPWGARSDAQDRPLRVNLRLDGRTGALLSREEFHQRNWVDQVVGYGVAAHEGQLFGLVNQLVSLFAATSLLLVSVSALVLWWRRRPAGVLGAPIPDGAPRFSAVLLAAVLMLAVVLPLLGLSLAVVAVMERVVLTRISPLRRWLGLRAPTLITG